MELAMCVAYYSDLVLDCSHLNLSPKRIMHVSLISMECC